MTGKPSPGRQAAPRRRRKERAVRAATTTAGVLLISTGLAGVILPILPGIPLVLFGGLLVARVNPNLTRLRRGVAFVRREVHNCSKSLRADLERRYPSPPAAGTGQRRDGAAHGRITSPGRNG